MVVGIRPGNVCVQAFGEYSWTASHARDVVSLPGGVSRGLHTRHAKAFKRGLYEVEEYLKVPSSLPTCMRIPSPFH